MTLVAWTFVAKRSDSQQIQCAGTLTVSGITATTLCPVAVPIGNLGVQPRLPRTNERRPDGRFSNETLSSVITHGLTTTSAG